MRKCYLVLLAILLWTVPAAAAELAGVNLPGEVEVGGQKLALAGMALRKVAVFKVYVAGLYLPAKPASGEAVLAADEPRQMINHYLRGVGQGRLCEGWLEGLEANTENPSAELKQQFDTLCEWMGDAEKDGRFSFTYVPGEGTTVALDGEVKGSVPGKAFADALFACWIGPDPGPGEAFKKAVLGG